MKGVTNGLDNVNCIRQHRRRRSRTHKHTRLLWLAYAALFCHTHGPQSAIKGCGVFKITTRLRPLQQGCHATQSVRVRRLRIKDIQFELVGPCQWHQRTTVRIKLQPSPKLRLMGLLTIRRLHPPIARPDIDPSGGGCNRDDKVLLRLRHGPRHGIFVRTALSR